jgi:hypothetical protein
MQTETDDTRTWPALILGDVPIYLVAGALLASCFALFSLYGVGEIGPALIAKNAQLYGVTALAMLVIDVVLLLVRHRPAEPAKLLLVTYRGRLTDPAVLARLPLFAIAIAFMPFFSKLKSMIPLFNDFHWDPTLIAWDRTLFFGHDAWQVLQPVLGYPIVTSVLAGLYHGWTLLIYGGALFFLFYRAARPAVRQYYLGFVLIWTLIGGGLATLFASVWPCFVGPIFGDPTFDAQMAYLNAANEQFPVLTLHVQDLLLQWYHQGDRGLGSGITAMPSMHVSMAMLSWLGMRQVSRKASWWFFAFFVVIWVASVHLAYHYAADGLVSMIATAAIWSASGALLRAWDQGLARFRQGEAALA